MKTEWRLEVNGVKFKARSLQDAEQMQAVLGGRIVCKRKSEWPRLALFLLAVAATAALLLAALWTLLSL